MNPDLLEPDQTHLEVPENAEMNARIIPRRSCRVEIGIVGAGGAHAT